MNKTEYLINQKEYYLTSNVFFICPTNEVQIPNKAE